MLLPAIDPAASDTFLTTPDRRLSFSKPLPVPALPLHQPDPHPDPDPRPHSQPQQQQQQQQPPLPNLPPYLLQQQQQHQQHQPHQPRAFSWGGNRPLKGVKVADFLAFSVPAVSGTDAPRVLPAGAAYDPRCTEASGQAPLHPPLWILVCSHLFLRSDPPDSDLQARCGPGKAGLSLRQPPLLLLPLSPLLPR
eukprot:1207036-Rhodomonas_salina.2